MNEMNENKWVEILEDHFRMRRKAFLVFDNDHILQHISEFASEILEIDTAQVGSSSVRDIFIPPKDNPEFLLDQDDGFQAVHDVTYTTPSGRPIEIRITFEQEDRRTGYLLWIEAKSREISSTFTKVSAFEPFKRLKWIFEKLGVGFLLLNKEGAVEDYNENLKEVLQLPGDWLGRNIFTFPAVHENKLGLFMLNSMEEANTPLSKTFKLRYAGTDRAVRVRWTGISLTDLRGQVIGALICTTIE